MKVFHVKNTRQFFLYLGCICIIFFYLYILYIGIFPKTCLEYNLYYIEDKLVNWSGYDGLKYDLNTELFCGNNYESQNKITPYLGKGWGNIEDNYIWTCEKESYLYFKLDKENKEKRDYKITIDINALASENTKIKIYSDEEDYIGEISNIDKNIYSFVIPFNSIKDNLLILKFEIQNPIQPSSISNSTDTRYLGISIKSLKIDIEN